MTGSEWAQLAQLIACLAAVALASWWAGHEAAAKAESECAPGCIACTYCPYHREDDR